ncbi:unnamed protein product [Sphagnum balticum]
MLLTIDLTLTHRGGKKVYSKLAFLFCLLAKLMAVEENGVTFKGKAVERSLRVGSVDGNLDAIQYRLGADARERQANLEYTFKQIVNSMFPALHRYMMRTAYHSKDIYAEEGGAAAEALCLHVGPDPPVEDDEGGDPGAGDDILAGDREYARADDAGAIGVAGGVRGEEQVPPLIFICGGLSG